MELRKIQEIEYETRLTVLNARFNSYSLNKVDLDKVKEEYLELQEKKNIMPQIDAPKPPTPPSAIKSCLTDEEFEALFDYSQDEDVQKQVLKEERQKNLKKLVRMATKKSISL